MCAGESAHQCSLRDIQDSHSTVSVIIPRQGLVCAPGTWATGNIKLFGSRPLFPGRQGSPNSRPAGQSTSLSDFLARAWLLPPNSPNRSKSPGHANFHLIVKIRHLLMMAHAPSHPRQTQTTSREGGRGLRGAFRPYQPPSHPWTHPPR